MVEVKNEVLKLSTFNIVLTALMLFPTFLALTLFGGLESQEFLLKNITYYGLGVLGLIGFTWLYIRYITKRSDADFGYAIIHNPKESIIYKEISPTQKTLSILRFRNILISGLIIFSVLGFFSVLTNTFFWQIPPIEQQFTETGKLIGATEPASTSETIIDLFLLCLLLSTSKWLQHKFKASDVFYYVSLIPIAVILGLWRVAYHSFRYGGSEASLLAVFLPAFAMTFVIVILGSVLWYFIWHDLNNLILGAKELFAKEAVVTVMIVAISIVLVIYISSIIASRFGRASRSVG